MSGAGVNRFETWDRATLAQFAHECNERIKQQDQEIEGLREDLRTAIDAYRELVVKHAGKTD
jgi:hypothetical protein